MLAGSLSCSLSSCFTGIESTKKVSLSREDKKLIAPSPEEEFFKGVSPLPLAEWQPGKRFIAADNKTILIFSQHGLPAEPDSARIGGKTLSFVRTEPKLEPDGSYSATTFSPTAPTLIDITPGKTWTPPLTKYTPTRYPC